MPRRTILTASDRRTLLAFPQTHDELIQHYTLEERDRAVIQQHRGDHNRLGFAVQLCCLRWPGFVLPQDATPPDSLLSIVGQQLRVDPGLWPQYAQRAETRREHLVELQVWMGLTPLSGRLARRYVDALTELAEQTDRGVLLAERLIDALRCDQVIVPSIEVIERICAQGLTRGDRRVHARLVEPLSDEDRRNLDGLLKPTDGGWQSALAWMQQPPGPPRAKHILTHIARLQAIQALGLPVDLGQTVHQNRLRKLAREGAQMTAQHLRDLEDDRRYATVVAVVQSTMATLIDEILGMHDRALNSLFNAARRKHNEQFHSKGKAINQKVRLFYRVGQALLDAKANGLDPFSAIEEVLPWDSFEQSITEARELSEPEGFDYLPLVADGFTQLRRYTPALFGSLEMRAVHARQDVLNAVHILNEMNEKNLRGVPEDAPTSFVGKRWQPLVFSSEGINRRFYELCVYSELKNALRSGDVWVVGSRQYRDFQEYLIPQDDFLELRTHDALGLSVTADHDEYMGRRIALLEEQLAKVERLAAAGELPDVTMGPKGFKITPLENAVPEEAVALTRRAYAMLPHVKITDLLLEVDRWTGFSRHFTHLKSGECTGDVHLLLTTRLANAINLGLGKMAESCPGMTYARLTWMQAWHIRDETYAGALSELTNTHYRHPFSAWWGDGTTSSSDGQRFRAGGQGEALSYLNPKYGSEPSVQFYTHISDQYAPFHTKVINSPVRDATHIFDGLLYHESELQIEEHYSDTAGFTDHVFALMHLLGFRFAPRIRDLTDNRLYVPGAQNEYPILAPIVGGGINRKRIRAEWEAIMRLATSIKTGTVTASLLLSKLAAYPRQSGLALALKELGRIERTLFILLWLQDPELRRRVQIGLNKGEAKNALARAVFFNRLGELRDKSFENQRYRASGLNLVVAAIIHWNTVYLQRAIQSLQQNGVAVDQDLLKHVSPLGWDHINLTGDYSWRENKRVLGGKFRPLRPQGGN